MNREDCVIYEGKSQPYDYFNECDEIYAFKPQPDRYLCFFKNGKKIIVTNAFRKATNKLPKSEKDMALKLRRDYLSRNPDSE